MAGNMVHSRVTLGENINAISVGAGKIWKGGAACMFAEASAWAGTLKLHMQTPQGTWINVVDMNGDPIALIANGTVAVSIPPGLIRFSHISSNPTGLYVWIAHMPT